MFAVYAGTSPESADQVRELAGLIADQYPNVPVLRLSEVSVSKTSKEALVPYVARFNNWNNLHEGDWEMIQLDFDAPTAQQALGTKPALVGHPS